MIYYNHLYLCCTIHICRHIYIGQNYASSISKFKFLYIYYEIKIYKFLKQFLLIIYHHICKNFLYGFVNILLIKLANHGTQLVVLNSTTN